MALVITVRKYLLTLIRPLFRYEYGQL